MKKFYAYSFLAGCISGSIVMFVPYVIPPIGDLFGSLFSAGGFPNALLYFIGFFVLSLPLFVLFLFLPVGRRGLKAARQKPLAGFLFLIYFALGVLAAYIVWLLFAFGAFSGSALAG